MQGIPLVPEKKFIVRGRLLKSQPTLEKPTPFFWQEAFGGNAGDTCRACPRGNAAKALTSRLRPQNRMEDPVSAILF